jgi:hypothetical protein
MPMMQPPSSLVSVFVATNGGSLANPLKINNLLSGMQPQSMSPTNIWEMNHYESTKIVM